VLGLQPWWQFATVTLNVLIDYERNQAFSHAWSLCVEEHFYLVFRCWRTGALADASAVSAERECGCTTMQCCERKTAVKSTA